MQWRNTNRLGSGKFPSATPRRTTHRVPAAGLSPQRALGQPVFFQRMGMRIPLIAVGSGFSRSIDKRFALSESRSQFQVEARAHSTGGNAGWPR